MSNANIISQGIDLLIFGMGTVFLFLTLLVFATSFMSWVLSKIQMPDQSAEQSSAPVAEPDKVEQVILAAISHFRKNHQR